MLAILLHMVAIFSWRILWLPFMFSWNSFRYCIRSWTIWRVMPTLASARMMTQVRVIILIMSTVIMQRVWGSKSAVFLCERYSF